VSSEPGAAHIVLHAVTVLDVVEEIVEGYVPEEAEETDRAFWEKKRDPTSLSVMDKIVASLKTTEAEQRLSYNKGHVALGSTGRNFCWFHPRKTPGYCHVEFKLSPDTRDAALATMQAKGIDASSKGAAGLSFSITNEAIDAHLETIVGELKKAEEASR